MTFRCVQKDFEKRPFLKELFCHPFITQVPQNTSKVRHDASDSSDSDNHDNDSCDSDSHDGTIMTESHDDDDRDYDSYDGDDDHDTDMTVTTL